MAVEFERGLISCPLQQSCCSAVVAMFEKSTADKWTSCLILLFLCSIAKSGWRWCPLQRSLCVCSHERNVCMQSFSARRLYLKDNVLLPQNDHLTAMCIPAHWEVDLWSTVSLRKDKQVRQQAQSMMWKSAEGKHLVSEQAAATTSKRKESECMELGSQQRTERRLGCFDGTSVSAASCVWLVSVASLSAAGEMRARPWLSGTSWPGGGTKSSLNWLIWFACRVAASQRSIMIQTALSLFTLSSFNF